MSIVSRLVSPGVQSRVVDALTPAHRPPLTRGRRWVAVAVAGAADAIQIALFPFFAEGWLSPLNIALDVAVGLVLTLLLGWHVVFLPGFLLEQIPFLDLAPTWTIAAMIAIRGRSTETMEPKPVEATFK